MRVAVTSPDRDLTPKMRAALAKSASPEGLGSWDYAAGIISAVKQSQLVERQADGRYHATEFGLRRLSGRSAR